MSGRLFTFGLVLLVFKFTVAQGQSTTQEFITISIACGLPKDQSYSDSRGIPYISDSEFIDTGESNVVSSPRNYIRSFPIGTRNCYKIKPVVEGWTYLVRTFFRYGNYDGLNKFPQFDVYLGINYWRTVYSWNASLEYNFETLVVAVSNSISICLVNTKQGIPIISAIELRRLPNSLYSEVNTSQSLSLLARQNLGGDFFRYPEDIYDRFWFADTDVILSPRLKASSTFSIRTSFRMEPSDVMRSLVYPDETATDLISNFSTEPVSSCPSNRAYLVFYFAEVQMLTLSESRILRVSVDGVVISGEIKPEYLKTSTFEKSISFSGNEFMCSVANASGSTKPPILNALEVYKIVDLSCQSETRTVDVDAIMDVKEIYMVKKNWHGDPCAPKAYMWEGLNCSFNGSNSPSITSLDLSSSGLSGAILASFANLTALQYMDLSSNSLTGGIPDFFSQLSQLKVLNLANNRLSGSIPKVLLDMSTNGQLNLSTVGNLDLCINSSSCHGDGSKKINKVSIIVISCIVVVILAVVISTVVWSSRGKELLKFKKMKKFTHQEIVRITENFKELIGEGGYGKVHSGKLGNGDKVAVKTLIKAKLSTTAIAGFQAEVDILTTGHHKKLVKLIGYCGHKRHLALVYDYMEGGSLHHHLSDAVKRTQLSWRKRLQIACEVAEGLKYLHNDCSPPIIHRDIKPGNILLTKELAARIGDFGLSKMFRNDVATHGTLASRPGGTNGYNDSDVRQARAKDDVYSFGVVLMNLITGLPPAIPFEEEDVEGNHAIVQWIRQTRSRDEVRIIFDKKIENDYDADSVPKVVNIAKECTKSEGRPDIGKVAADLHACVEQSSKKNHASSSTGVNRETSDQDPKSDDTSSSKVECTKSEGKPDISKVAADLQACVEQSSKKNHASSSTEINRETSDQDPKSDDTSSSKVDNGQISDHAPLLFNTGDA